MKRYNFDRYVYGRLMAEGVTVHADTLEEAQGRAPRFASRPFTHLHFTDNAPCARATRCPYCHPQEARK